MKITRLALTLAMLTPAFMPVSSALAASKCSEFFDSLRRELASLREQYDAVQEDLTQAGQAHEGLQSACEEHGCDYTGLEYYDRNHVCYAPLEAYFFSLFKIQDLSSTRNSLEEQINQKQNELSYYEEYLFCEDVWTHEDEEPEPIDGGNVTITQE